MLSAVRPEIAASSSRNAVSFSSPRAMHRFPLWRCASAVKSTRPVESICEIVQRYHPGDLFLAREDGQPAKASLPHELFSLFNVLVLEATNEVGTHVIAHGRRVGVMPVSGGPDSNIAIGHHPHETLALADWQRAQVE